MTEISKARIVEAAEDADIDPEDGDIRWDYAARGMLGDTCFGIVGSLETYTQFMLQLAARDDEGAEIASELARYIRTDNMGRRTIFYFPHVTVEG